MKSPPDYELLAVADRKGLPAVMLRAHALNADSFGKTLDGGACAYLTRDRLFESGLTTSKVVPSGVITLEELDRFSG